ncbi:MAG: hypothetical protein OEP52_05240 [Acidimicrobiia bacterium]|nr:hypothetical protein [Acidimicrobiia bacterium]
MTDQPETIAGFALERLATVEEVVGEEALSRLLVELVNKVGSVPPFGPAVRARVLAIDEPDELGGGRLGVRVRAQTWRARHCKCPNCGGDHQEHESTHGDHRPHFDEAWVQFTVANSAFISLWDEYASTGYHNVFHGQDWGNYPY